MSLVMSRLGSQCVYQEAVYFYCCSNMCFFVKFTDLIFIIYEFEE